MQLRLPPSATRYDPVLLGGGLDLLTPPSQLKPGIARDAVNFEQSITGGYARINGYERYSGQPQPSLQTYLTITVVLTAAIVAGNTITGLTSGATGVVTDVIDVGGGHTVVAYTKATSAFAVGENVRVGGITKAVVYDLGGATQAADFDVTQTAKAADVYRADIAAVPGAGPIRGGWTLGNVNYAARNNAGNTALVFYKESSTGWVLVPFGYEVAFTLGTSEYAVGETLTKGAVNALITGVSVESGDWLAGTAAGHLTIAAPTGGSFTAGVSAGGGAATLSGAEAAITLAPSGRVETDQGDFGAGIRVYGADGVNQFMWEFDGTTLVKIRTGIVGVAPKHPLIHKDHLFAAFANNLAHSGIDTPYNWSVVAGGAQYVCSSVINALSRQPGSQAGGAMSISLVDATEMLYGISAADFQKVSFEESGGARPYAVQRLGGQTFAYGDIGVMSISATQSFGNFAPASMTMNIRPFTQIRKTLCTASLVNREKSQFRLFFSDSYGLYMTIVNGRLMGSMPVFFPNPVTCAWKGANADGAEVAFFGSTNGMVYKLDAGTSHDGAPINSFITLTFANQGNARRLKRYRGAELEVQGDGYAEFQMTYEVGYGAADKAQGVSPTTASVSLASTYWDTPSFVWDTFTWDGKNLSPTHVEISGTGENIALRVECNDARFPSFTLNSAVLHYSLRKALKS